MSARIRKSKSKNSDGLTNRITIEGTPINDDLLLHTLLDNKPKLYMSMDFSRINLCITYQIKNQDQIIKIDTSPCCTIYVLKLLILHRIQNSMIDDDFDHIHEDYELDDMQVFYSSKHLNEKYKTLSYYGINGSSNSLSTGRPMSKELNSSGKLSQYRFLNNSGAIDGSLNFYDLTLVLTEKSQTGKFNFGLDFTFNIVNDVK